MLKKLATQKQAVFWLLIIYTLHSREYLIHNLHQERTLTGIRHQTPGTEYVHEDITLETITMAKGNRVNRITPCANVGFDGLSGTSVDCVGFNIERGRSSWTSSPLSLSLAAMFSDMRFLCRCFCVISYKYKNG